MMVKIFGNSSAIFLKHFHIMLINLELFFDFVFRSKIEPKYRPACLEKQITFSTYPVRTQRNCSSKKREVFKRIKTMNIANNLYVKTEVRKVSVATIYFLKTFGFYH